MPFFVAFILLTLSFIFHLQRGILIEQEEKKKQIPNLYHALIGLISIIMKADGQATKSELVEIKSFLLKKYGERKAKKLLQLLKQMLQKEIINFRPHCLQLNRSFTYQERLDFLILLFRIANANNGICGSEVDILQQIARHTAIRNSDFQKLQMKFSSGYKWKETNQNRQTKEESYNQLQWAYEALEITKNATEAEIKKAYRKLAMKYHPDKISSTDIIAQQQAAEKFRKINDAYRCIKKERSID